jgi:hypothetical protein
VVGIDNQFLFWLEVVKHSHSLTANYAEALLFERVQPAYENVGLNTACELECTECGVNDGRIEVSPSVRRDIHGQFTQDP